MATFAASILAIGGFLLAFAGLNLVGVARQSIDRAHGGVTAMLDSHLPEEEKEAAVQAAGLALLGLTVQLAWRIAVCLGAAVLPLYIADALGVVALDDVLSLMLRLDYIVATSVVIGAIAWALSGSGNKGSYESAYSGSDQLTHKLAFAGPAIQLTAADIEDRLFRKRLESVPDEAPIFVTSLPRAGTTILLTALDDLPSLASHRYRDMPFVMAPLLWSAVSRFFAKQGEMAERAHGDGIMVGFESPEAFEEVIWRAFYPRKYGADSLELWDSDDYSPEAATFFRAHFRKIIALRTDGSGRYLSKNNNNFARLALLPEMFPGAQIVVPLREPAEHAASLLRQHRNFLRLHAEDPFVKRYMRDIGHLEFGELHKPFAFPGLAVGTLSPEEPDYWLNYWIAAYRMALACADKLIIVSQERLAAEPDEVMDQLCDRLGLDNAGMNLARHFRPIGQRADEGTFNSGKLAEAEELYRALRKNEL